MSEELNIEINENDLEKTPIISSRNRQGGKPRTIVVKFIRYFLQNIIYSNNEKLKKKNFVITEYL